MDVVLRSAWGAAPARRVPTPLKKHRQRGLAVHHSGAQGDRRDHHRHCPGVVRGIQRYHQRDKRWSDVAYSYLVCQHGTIFVGRGQGVRTAANGTVAANAAWHAVCYLGDGEDVVIDERLEGALLEVRRRVRLFSPGALAVWPHLRFRSTTCPGGALREWCRQFP